MVEISGICTSPNSGTCILNNSDLTAVSYYTVVQNDIHVAINYLYVLNYCTQILVFSFCTKMLYIGFVYDF